MMTVTDYTKGEKQVFSKKPQSSPWGEVQQKVKYIRGVSLVSTAGHGGLLVSKGFAAKNFTQGAIKRGNDWNGYLAYEEDCDIAIALFELPQIQHHFSKANRDSLIKELSYWTADYLIERGIEPEPEAYKEYLVRKKDRKLRLEKSPDLIVSAMTMWEDVAKVVKVYTADGNFHFVTLESYQKRSGLNLLSKCELVEDYIQTTDLHY